jgi:hypothetical protein
VDDQLPVPVVYGPGKGKRRATNHAMDRDGLPACGQRLSYVTVGEGNVGCLRCLRLIGEMKEWRQWMTEDQEK